MLVREIMTAPAFFVHVNAPVEDVLETLAVRSATAVPVLDDESRLAGIVSEIDLLKGALSRDEDGNHTPPDVASDVMKTDVVTAAEGEHVEDIVERISTRKIRVLPVMRGDRLVGVVSRSDIVRALYRPDDELEGDLLADLFDAGLTSCRLDVQRGRVTITCPDADADVARQVVARTIGVRSVTVA